MRFLNVLIMALCLAAPAWAQEKPAPLPSHLDNPLEVAAIITDNTNVIDEWYKTPVNKPFYDVQAIVGKAAPGEVQVTLYCNQREFSELEHGDQLFSVVAREIVEQRRESERYRCYITDLDLSGLLGDAQSSSNLYLRYKADLERALNEALEQV